MGVHFAETCLTTEMCGRFCMVQSHNIRQLNLRAAMQGDDMVKVVAWYDNEWGYSQRYVAHPTIIASMMA